MTLPRRNVIGAALGLGACVVTAACTTVPSPGEAPSAPGAPATREAEQERETEDGPAVAPPTPGTRLGPAHAVPIGGATIYPSAAVVVAHPDGATYRAFSAVCPHAGCRVDKVQDGTIRCPCHGSEFHLDGTVAVGPAARPLTTLSVTVEGDTLVLS